MRTRHRNSLTFIFTLMILLTILFPAHAQSYSTLILPEDSMPWFYWPIILFVICFFIGIIAVLGGVGGGILFVTIGGSFFPFHFDFIRGTGLLIALSSALSAGPGLLKAKMIDLRLAMPAALIASFFSIIGAHIGLHLPASLLQLILGFIVIGICFIMVLGKKTTISHNEKADKLSQILQISGIYYEPTTKKEINWKAHNTPLGFFLFSIVGLLAGMFGLGAGWANVPVLNLIMGVPLKISVATSSFMLSITDSSAAWIYINSGAILPILVMPSIAGIMIGSFIGVNIFKKTKPKFIRWIVIALLAFAGIRTIIKGLSLL